MMENIEQFVDEQLDRLAGEMDQLDLNKWCAWLGTYRANLIPEKELLAAYVGERNGSNGTLRAIQAVIERGGYTVSRCRMSERGLMGQANYWRRTIRIRAGLPYDVQTSLLVHEWTHMLIHAGEVGWFKTTDQKELEAEATAYVVCQALGIKTQHSPIYLRICYMLPSAELYDPESRRYIALAAKHIVRKLEEAGLICGEKAGSE